MAGTDKFQLRNLLKTVPLRITFLFILFFCLFTEVFSQPYTIPNDCSGTSFNFLQPGAPGGTTYSWAIPVVSPAGAVTGGTAQSSRVSVSDLLVNSTTSAATATYIVVPSVGGIPGVPFQLTVTVNPLPVLSNAPVSPAVCSGLPFNYTPQSATSGTNITWSRGPVAGISNTAGLGTGSVSEILTNTTVNTALTVNYVFTLIANGCSNTQTVPLIVNPLPVLSSPLTVSPICSGSNFNYTPTTLAANPSFTWSRAVVAGISNGAVNNNNSPNPNEQLDLTSGTLVPVTATYVYTITNGVTGCVSNNQNVTVSVKPVPNVPANQTVNNSCSGNSFFFSPANITPAGTLYTWTNPAISPAGTITGASANSVGQLYVSQALTNISASPATAVYTVTPNANGCTGSAFNLTVTVNTTSSTLVLSSSLTPPAVCSGSIFSYLPASTTLGFSAAWTRFQTAGISNGYATGTGNPNETLVNTTTLPVTVSYEYTLTSPGGCSNKQTVAVVVNPAAGLSSTQTPVAICSNTIFSYVPTSNTPATAFNWSRVTVSGISNAAATGNNNPNEILINTTNLPVSVNYVYSLITASGCSYNQTVTVPVNPAPVLSSLLNPTAICSGTIFNYTPTTLVSNPTYAWTRAVVPGISNGAGAGVNNPAENLINTTVAAVTVPYNYTVTANGCSANQTVSVVVNPTPNVANLTATTCSNTAFIITPSPVPANTQYTWAMPVNNPAASVTGDTTQPVPQNNISQLLINQTLNPATAKYTVTPASGACTGANFTITVTVNPVPVVANQLMAAICSGTSFSYTPGSIPAGTTYTWSNPVLAPVNSLMGGSAQPISQANISQALSSTNNLSDTAVYTVTPSAYGCPGNTFTITVPVKPVPVINNISDTICSKSLFSITPMPVPANTTYTWPTPVNFPFGSVIGGTAQAVPVSTISQILTNTTNNTAQTLYTISPSASGCSGASFLLTVTVGVPLPFIPDQTALICSGTQFDATPVTSKPGTTYTWSIPTVTPPGSVTGISAASAPQTIVSQTLNNLGNVTDTVVYTVLPYNTGCRGNLFTATVRVIALPKATITGKAVVCRYPYDTLSVSFTGMGPWNFTYLNDTIPGSQTGITTSPYNWVVPSVPGIPTRKLQITSVRDMACFNNKDTSIFVQKINPLPVGFIVSMHGAYICNNIPDTLFVNAAPADTLTYQWTINGSPVPGAVTDSLGTLRQGNYNAILTNQYGCKDTAAKPASLTYITQPVLRFSYDSYCINKIINFTNRTDTAFTGPVQWLWDLGDSTFANTYHAADVYTGGGDRHVRLSATQLYCPAYTTSMDTTINIQYPIAPVRLPSVSAYKNVFTPVAARNIPGYRYLWTPSRGIDMPDSAMANFNYQNTQDYVINLISPGGCVTYDSLLVRVFDNNLVDILVPKSFTPNGDGVNDILYPYLTGIKTFQYFKVYNRYGKLMFETTNPDTGWNGMLNGTPQPMSIYIWIAVGIANDGSSVQKRGETLLLR